MLRFRQFLEHNDPVDDWSSGVATPRAAGKALGRVKKAKSSVPKPKTKAKVKAPKKGRSLVGKVLKGLAHTPAPKGKPGKFVYGDKGQ
jgi:hypothetical protein